MQHEVKTVKKTTKKYNTKDGKKESISKRIDLGVDSVFAVGDEVAITFKTDFDKLTADSDGNVAELEKIIADKDAAIDNLNGSVDKFKKELKDKADIIAAKSKEIKALKSKVSELESDISAKGKTIDKLTATVSDNDAALTESGNTIDGLNDKVDELTATVGELKPLLLSKDSTIGELEKQIAVYDAMDVDVLKEKAAELNKTKNVIILQQKQITEYIQLVNYHKETATAYKNQNAFSKLIGRDAAANIIIPDLVLIDSSGNPIPDNDDAATGNDNGSDSGKSETPET